MDEKDHQILAQLLQLEGEDPTGTPADLARIATHYHGYRNAYLQLNAEVGGLRAELQGNKTGYQKLQDEVGNLSSQLPGYKTGYETLEEEVGSLGMQVVAFRRAYEALAREVRGRALPPAVPFTPQVDHHFLIVGNGRTGSSWLITSLDRVPGVRARLELKWLVPWYERIPDHVPVERTTASMNERIELACFDGEQPENIRCAGSKLIFDPYWFMSPEIFRDLRQMIEPDMRLILLKRRYCDCWLSWKVRGVHHAFDMEVVKDLPDVDLISLTTASKLPKPVPQRIVLIRFGQPFASPDEGGTLYSLNDAIDDLLMFFSNDLQTMALLLERGGGLVIDYPDIGGRMSEIARYIGADATDEEIAKVVRMPATLKLSPLDGFVSPLEVLAELSDALDSAFWDVARKKRSVDEVWRWKPDGVVKIDIPAFRAVLERLGLAPSPPASPIVEWTLRKPAYLL